MKLRWVAPTGPDFPDLKDDQKSKNSLFMRALGRVSSRTRGFCKDRRGGASVEFVLIAPLYFALMLSTFEAGWLMTKSMMLERGMDLTMRDLRLGLYPNPKPSDFKKIICDHAAILKDCESAMLLELVPINSVADVPKAKDTVCRDRSPGADPNPKVNFTQGGASQIMYVRACVVVDPLVPGIGLALHLPLDPTGGLAMVSYGAFTNEPS